METRDLIIETAFISFIEKGYNRISLNQIIKSTGLTKGAFYHYFSSKDELIGELMNTYFFSHIRRTMDIVEVDGHSFMERMEVVFKNVLNINVNFVSRPDLEVTRSDFMKLFWESTNMNDDMKQKFMDYQFKITEVMTRTIEVGQKQGEIREDINPKEVAGLMNAAVRGTILSSNMMSQEMAEKILRQNMNTIIQLIMKK